jgi:YfiH family protein
VKSLRLGLNKAAFLMIEKNIHGATFLFFENLLPFRNLVHGISTRNGGLSSAPYASLNLGADTGDAPERVAGNYEIVSTALGFNLTALVASKQVHGKQMAVIDDAFIGRAAFSPEPSLQGYDALATRSAGVTLMVRVADCVPVILFVPERQIVAVVHAGWRGTLAGIAGEAVRKMVQHYQADPGDIRAGIGPAIGPCCYCVQEEVAAAFKNSSHLYPAIFRETRGELFLNLWEANRLQLLRQGLSAGNIETAGLCTSCRTDLFFSHRREEGKTGRFGAFAGLRE